LTLPLGTALVLEFFEAIRFSTAIHFCLQVVGNWLILGLLPHAGVWFFGQITKASPIFALQAQNHSHKQLLAVFHLIKNLAGADR